MSVRTTFILTFTRICIPTLTRLILTLTFTVTLTVAVTVTLTCTLTLRVQGRVARRGAA